MNPHLRASGSAYFMTHDTSKIERHTLSVLVDNEPGILARIAGLFSARGFNIDSLTVSETEHEKGLSRITVVSVASPKVLEQIKLQLERLIPVHKVHDLTEEGKPLEREMALVKVAGKGENRVETLRLADALPEPIFTPATKADAGDHDENISFDACVELIGGELAEQVRAAAFALYRFAQAHARERGIIIADTKFEFGLDESGKLVLIDEALTPDSSRFWPADSWQPGTNPPSFDKQFIRDWVETSGWDKRPPAPHLPAHIIEQSTARYAEARRRLTLI